MYFYYWFTDTFILIYCTHSKVHIIPSTNNNRTSQVTITPCLLLPLVLLLMSAYDKMCASLCPIVRYAFCCLYGQGHELQVLGFYTYCSQPRMCTVGRGEGEGKWRARGVREREAYRELHQPARQASVMNSWSAIYLYHSWSWSAISVMTSHILISVMISHITISARLNQQLSSISSPICPPDHHHSRSPWTYLAAHHMQPAGPAGS